MPNDTTENETDSTEQSTDPQRSTADDVSTDDVSGVYYDADAGVFCTVTMTADGVVNVFTGANGETHDLDEETPVETYASSEAFHVNETELYPVSREVVADPVSVAEDVYSHGFTSLIEVHQSMNDIDILYATERTEIVEQT